MAESIVHQEDEIEVTTFRKNEKGQVEVSSNTVSVTTRKKRWN
jgi:hypothetical protein